MPDFKLDFRRNPLWKKVVKTLVSLLHLFQNPSANGKMLIKPWKRDSSLLNHHLLRFNLLIYLNTIPDYDFKILHFCQAFRGWSLVIWKASSPSTLGLVLCFPYPNLKFIKLIFLLSQNSTVIPSKPDIKGVFSFRNRQ